MIKRSFFGFSQSYLTYDKMAGPLQAIQKVPVSGRVTLLVKSPYDPVAADGVAPGLKVKTGQKLTINANNGAYAIATVTGTVRKIAGFSGDFGRMWTEITIDAADREETGTPFQAAGADDPDLPAAIAHLLPVPGAPDLGVLNDPDHPIHTIVVNGVDRDLMITTTQHTLAADIDAVKSGIAALKKISGIDRIVIAVSRDMIQGFGHIGAVAKAVDNRYPAGLPHNIMADVLGQPVPAGKTCEEMGVCFLGAEAVASIGKAFDTGSIPVDKTVTVVDKNGNRTLVSARIGAPVGDIFTAVGITVDAGDRIIFGGPMTGEAVYSEDYPVGPDTDAVIVQAGADIPLASDYPCIGCGECIRVCPARVPVDMLVRFLEAGQYEEAADGYDLYACVECGLCSFVCVSKIPIFQYIKLAKYELGRIDTEEASNE